MSSNPMLNQRVCENVILDSEPMTVNGAISKTALSILIVMLCGYFTWNLCANGFMDKANLMSIVGLIGGIILSIITIVKPQSSPITTPFYAVCEGVLLGSISYSYNAFFDGIVVNAIGITLLALLSMLFLYRTKIIQATPTFRKVIFTATIAVFVFYLIGFIAALFGHPMTIFNGGMVGIGVSLLICAIASFNLIIDFDFVENGSNRMLPKYFEWYSAFSLMVTLIWIYIEVLRLLAQLQRRD